MATAFAFEASNPVVSLEIVKDVPTQAYFDMHERARMDRFTGHELRKYLGLAAGTPLMFSPYDRVTLLGNQPYHPGYAMMTKVSFGTDFEHTAEIVTTDGERPLPEAVTTHLGMRIQELGGWVRRQVLEVDELSEVERQLLNRNSALTYDLNAHLSAPAMSRAA